MHETEPAKPEKQLEVAEIFRHSYIFSQGEPRLQIHLFNWLARTEMRGMPPPTDEELRVQKVARYGSAESRAGGHKFVASTFEIDARESASRFQSALKNGGQTRLPTAKGAFSQYNEDSFPKAMSDWTDDDFLRAIIYNLIEKDFQYLSMGGRPVSEERRDRWSSFIIDFGVLERGTRPWAWEHVPKEFKHMWKAVMERLNQPLHPLEKSFLTFPHYTLLLKVIRVYLTKHPDLPPDDRAKIEQFRKQIVDAALAFTQAYSQAHPDTDVSWFRNDFLRAADPNAP